ncbi:MAG: hypothetical protein QNJ27_03115 [Simkaniaceae bacterium]|nr:hypothetical protein [Simkaniaceae bacterium]
MYLYFLKSIPPYSWGGVTPFTVNIVNGLASLGIKVNLLTICEKEGFEQQDNGVNIHRIHASGIYKDEYIDTSEGLKRHFQFLKKARHLFECAVHKEVAEISKQKELEIVQNQAIEKQQAMEKDLSKGLSL